MKRSLLTFIILLLLPSILLAEILKDSPKYKHQREEMVLKQIRMRGISDEKVLNAMTQVPRHFFVPKKLSYKAYSDHPLPIGSNSSFGVMSVTWAIRFDSANNPVIAPMSQISSSVNPCVRSVS